MSMAWFLGAVADQAAAAAASVPGGASSPASFSTMASPLANTAALPWWRIGLLFLIFIGLAVIWVWVNRGRVNLRSLLQPGERRIVIAEQRWLNGRTLICLVEVEGERFLLVQGQGMAAWQPLQAKASPGPAASSKN
jgi:flagellar biogenesis protein FliO